MKTPKDNPAQSTNFVAYSEIFSDTPTEYATRTVLRELVLAIRPHVDALEHATYSFSGKSPAEMQNLTRKIQEICYAVSTQLDTMGTLQDIRTIFLDKPSKQQPSTTSADTTDLPI